MKSLIFIIIVLQLLGLEIITDTSLWIMLLWLALVQKDIAKSYLGLIWIILPGIALSSYASQFDGSNFYMNIMLFIIAIHVNVLFNIIESGVFRFSKNIELTNSHLSNVIEMWRNLNEKRIMFYMLNKLALLPTFFAIILAISWKRIIYT